MSGWSVFKAITFPPAITPTTAIISMVTAYRVERKRLPKRSVNKSAMVVSRTRRNHTFMNQ